jgi:putative cardiolipin synthase
MVLGMTGCAPLPSLEGRTVSAAFVRTSDTRLGRAVEPVAAKHPGTSGVHPLLDARDAFAARVLLARAAERSLDIQYYIWQDDVSGRLLFRELHDAAARGIRVRLLLDDNGVSGLDPTLAGLDAHPNIEVRLFNPFARRGALRWLGYVTDFPRLNRRMHNKSFTADNQATIVGGRNIGDEYFDAVEEGLAFVDLDVLAVGPVVRQVSKDFDRYWASGAAYPVDRILQGTTAASQAEPGDAKAERYMEAVRTSPFVQELLEGRLAFEWAPTRMLSDDPAKGLGAAPESALLPNKLGELLGEPKRNVELVSAYFVPAETGTDMLVQMARRGVKVRILTNALEATDVAPVHAGYAKRRRELLEAGVTLYELRRLSPHRGGESRLVGASGSSASSLHAKTFAVDGERVFIGSFNFDPRSARLNTEMGFVIESRVMAQRMAAAFDGGIPAASYEPRLSAGGKLYWIEHREGQELRHDTEPGASAWQRAAVCLIALLPVEWLL